MVVRDVVLAKVAAIEHCLERIAAIRSEERNLAEVDREELTILNIQRAAQAAIDLAAHVVATEGFGLPDKLADHFTILENHGILAPPLAARLRRMVGFRNIAVHEYEEVDPTIVEAIVASHLGDFRDLCRAVLKRFEGSD